MRIKVFIILLLGIFIASCSSNGGMLRTGPNSKLQRSPKHTPKQAPQTTAEAVPMVEYPAQQPRTLKYVDYSMPDYAARVLKDKLIVLDPGHGDDSHLARYKAGPTELREANINLRSAGMLRGYLQQAGAKVILTREGDSNLSLSARAKIANDNNADLFISMHHNAFNFKANNTTVYYHGEPDFMQPSLDIARYINNELAHNMNVRNGGLRSDFSIYRGSGFGVLRPVKVPACLGEVTHHSCAEEEQMLRSRAYAKREAWGYFMGIAKYFEQGVPFARLVAPEEGGRIAEKQPKIHIRFDDGKPYDNSNNIIPSSIQLMLDGEAVTDFEYTPLRGDLKFTPADPLANNYHSLEVRAVSIYKNSMVPKTFSFQIAPPAKKVIFTADPPVAPADGISYVFLTVNVMDEDGQPVADNTMVKFSSTIGSFEKAEVPTKDGIAYAYLNSPAAPGSTVITVACDEMTMNMGKIEFKELAGGSLTGTVTDRENDNALNNTEISLVSMDGESFEVKNASEGRFFSSDIAAGSYTLVTRAESYRESRMPVIIRSGGTVKLDIKISPIAGGVLKGKTYVLDPQFGGEESGDLMPDGTRAADLNLKLAGALANLYKTAGADVIITRTEDITMSVDERIDFCDRPENRRGWYLRIEHQNLDEPKGAGVYTYPRSTSLKTHARPMATEIASQLGLPDGGAPDNEAREIRLVPQPAMSATVYSINNPDVAEIISQPGYFSKAAYGLYLGTLVYNGLKTEDKFNLTVKVRDSAGNPVAGAGILLDGTTPLETGPDGIAAFKYLYGDTHYISVAAKGFTTAQEEISLYSNQEMTVTLK